MILLIFTCFYLISLVLSIENAQNTHQTNSFDNIPILNCPLDSHLHSATSILLSQEFPFSGSPPVEIPAALIPYYSRCNAIPIEQLFIDECNGGMGYNYQYPRSDVEKFIKTAEKSYHSIVHLPRKIRPVFELLAQLDERGLIQGRRALVVGSIEPNWEAALLVKGIRSVVTSDFNRPSFVHPRLNQLHPTELNAFVAKEGKFDLILAINSVDHTGLGRYCDPLEPDGDIRVTRDLAEFLTPNEGILLLTLPIGPDLVIYNLGRRYGKIRLPALLHGFEIIERAGWDEKLLEKPADFKNRIESSFLLKPIKSSAASTSSTGPSQNHVEQVDLNDIVIENKEL